MSARDVDVFKRTWEVGCDSEMSSGDNTDRITSITFHTVRHYFLQGCWIMSLSQRAGKIALERARFPFATRKHNFLEAVNNVQRMVCCPSHLANT